MEARPKVITYYDYGHYLMGGIRAHILDASDEEMTEQEKMLVDDAHNIMFCNEVAKCFVIEFEGHFRNSGTSAYKNQAKRSATEASKLCRVFEKGISGVLDFESICSYADMNQYMEDKARPVFEDLHRAVFEAVSQGFGYRVEDCSTKGEKIRQRAWIAAESEAVRVVSMIAVNTMEFYIEKWKGFEGNVMEGIRWIDFTKIYKEVDTCSKYLMLPVKGVDLNKDIQVRHFVRKITQVLLNRENVKNAMQLI